MAIQHQQEVARQQYEARLSRAQAYTERAEKEYGITPQELSVAGNAVHQIGIHEDVADMLVDHEAGPAVTKYLSQNVQELVAMRDTMTPLQQAVYIDRKILPKVNRKAAKPPPPADSVEGKGVNSYNEGPEGATYD